MKITNYIKKKLIEIKKLAKSNKCKMCGIKLTLPYQKLYCKECSEINRKQKLKDWKNNHKDLVKKYRDDLWQCQKQKAEYIKNIPPDALLRLVNYKRIKCSKTKMRFNKGRKNNKGDKFERKMY